MRLVHLPESLDATKEDLLGHRQRVMNRIEATQEGPVQWSSLAGFFFRPVGRLGQAFPPGLSRPGPRGLPLSQL
jgi:hypothetical protein